MHKYIHKSGTTIKTISSSKEVYYSSIDKLQSRAVSYATALSDKSEATVVSTSTDLVGKVDPSFSVLIVAFCSLLQSGFWPTSTNPLTTSSIITSFADGFCPLAKVEFDERVAIRPPGPVGEEGASSASSEMGTRVARLDEEGVDILCEEEEEASEGGGAWKWNFFNSGAELDLNYEKKDGKHSKKKFM